MSRRAVDGFNLKICLKDPPGPSKQNDAADSAEKTSITPRLRLWGVVEALGQTEVVPYIQLLGYFERPGIQPVPIKLIGLDR